MMHISRHPGVRYSAKPLVVKRGRLGGLSAKTSGSETDLAVGGGLTRLSLSLLSLFLPLPLYYQAP